MADDKHRLEIEIVANGDQAVEEIKKVQQAEDQLHDKTVTINVVTKQSGGSGDAARMLSELTRGSRGASDASSGLARAAEQAANRMRDHAGASDAASRSNRALASESSRADAGMRQLAGSTERASRSMRSMETAGRSMERVSGTVMATAAASQVLAGSMERSNTVMASAGSSATRMAGGMSASVKPMRSMSDELADIERGLVSGDAAMQRFSVQAARLGSSGGGGGGGIPPTGRGTDLGFGGIGDEGADNIGRGAKAVGGATMSLRTMGRAAIGAGAAWLGMAAVTAATAGIGAAGAFLGIRQAPQLMHEAQQAVEGFNGEFKKTRQAMTDAGMPAMKGLTAAAKGLGAELAKVGVDNIGILGASGAGLVSETTAAVQKLEPAIKPAIGAMTALGTAGIRAFGDSAPAITSFSNSIMQNAGGIQQAIHGVVGIASGVGQAITQGVGELGPIIDKVGQFANAAGGNGGGGQASASGIGSFLYNNLVPQSARAAIASNPVANFLLGDPAQFGGGGGGSADMFGSFASETPHSPGIRPAGSFQAGRPYAPGEFAGASYQNHVDAAGNVVSDLYGANAQAGPGVPSMGKVPPPPSSQQQQPSQAPAAPPATGGQTMQQLTQQQQAQTLGFGSGTRAMPAGAAQQIAQATAAYQQLGQTAQSSMSQVNQASTTGGQGVQQHMQQATQAVNQAAPAMQAAASKIPQSIAQGANSQPGAVQGAVHQQVRQASSGAAPAAAAGGGNMGAAMSGGMGKSITKSETDTLTIAKRWATRVTSGAAPQAAAGGADAGAAIGGGMGKGITKTETDTLTIVKKWVTKIIDTGKGALGISSPSKVFAGMGMNVAQGMAVGIAAGSSQAVTASSQMAAGVVQGAAKSLGGSGSVGQQMASGVGAQLASTGAQYGQQFAGNFAAQAGGNQAGRQFGQVARPGFPGTPPPGQTPPGPGGGRPLTPQQQAALQQQQQQQQGRMFGLDANGKPISPEDAIKSGMFPEGSQAAFRARALGRITNEPTNYVLRAQAHNERADMLRQERQQRHQDALTAARQGITPQEAAAQRTAQEQQQAMREANAGQLQSQDRLRQNSLDPFRTTPPPPPSQTLQQSINDHLFNSQQTIEQNKQKGEEAGRALSLGAAQGVQQGQDQAAQAVVALGKNQQEAFKKEHGIASPSTVFAQMSSEIGAGMSQGLASASDSIQGVASDRGLQVGYTYGRSFVTGADSVIKKDLFQGISRPQIDSPQAMAALGAAGFLGPAGSGAQIPKSRTVTLSPGSGSSGTPQINATVLVTVDGAGPMRVIASEVVDVAMDHLGDSLQLQRTA